MDEPQDVVLPTQDEPQINMLTRENLEPDLIKHFLDSDSLYRSVFGALGGAYRKEKPYTIKKYGYEKKGIELTWDFDKRNAVGNKSFCNHIYHTIYPLTSPDAKTSNVSKTDLFKNWDTTINDIEWEMVFNALLFSNSWDLRKGSITATTSFLCRNFIAAKKADGGWFMGKVSDIESTMNIHRVGGDLNVNKKQGFVDNALSKIRGN